MVTTPDTLGGRLARDDLIQIKGTIVEALAGGNYRVKGDNGMEFLAKIGGRMRRFHIRVDSTTRDCRAAAGEASAACGVRARRASLDRRMPPQR